jgi:uncharacterized membrane protein YphA (DoxX/SURF4 family)
MTIALWIINIVLALAFLTAGITKVSRPKVKLAGVMGWVEDFQAPSVKLIGTAEIVGALGLTLPLFTGIAVVIAPIAAVCLAVLMVGAVVVHARRKESFASSLVLGAISVVSAVIGFIVL